MAATAAGVVAAVSAEAGRRGPRHEATWIAPADGSKDQIARIRAQAAARGITVPVICDLIHVPGHLRDAAWCLFPKASPDAGPRVRARTAQIPEGAAAAAAAALRAASGPGKARSKITTRTAGRLEAKISCLDYPAAPASGRPVSAGVTEGACRHLVKDRTDITGARRAAQTAEAVLELRALTASSDRGPCWHWPLAREHERNHPARYALAA